MGRRSIGAVALAVGATAMAAMAPAAWADSGTPLRGTLEGSVDVAPCGVATLCLTGTAEGHVSHLGRTTLTKTTTIYITGGICASGGVASTYTEGVTLTSSNGDVLELSGEGAACAASGRAIGRAELRVTGGSGRFEGATGQVIETIDHNLITDSELTRLTGTLSSLGSK